MRSFAWTEKNQLSLNAIKSRPRHADRQAASGGIADTLRLADRRSSHPLPLIPPNRKTERAGINAVQASFDKCGYVFQSVAFDYDFGKDATSISCMTALLGITGNEHGDRPRRTS
jgi:hypothetical protein